MSKNQPVESPDAPRAIGPYSQAIECRPDRMLFLSGQIALAPATGPLVPAGIAAPPRQVLAHPPAVLVAGGMDPWNVLPPTLFLVDMQDFGTVNSLYGEFFGDHRPARATVQVAALPRGARVEIEAVAAG